MVDLLDKENQHLLLHREANPDNSFIANVNKLALHLDEIKSLNGTFTQEEIDGLLKLLNLDIKIITDDLKKGSLFGFRKLDIDLLLNFIDYSDDLTDEEKNLLWNNFEKQVYYSSITVKFTDKVTLYKDFNTSDVNHVINNHHQLYDQLSNWNEFKAKAVYTMFSISPNTPITNHELLRVWDGEGFGSNIESITLHVANPPVVSCSTEEITEGTINKIAQVIGVTGTTIGFHSGYAGAKEHDPIYTWLSSTSILEAIFGRINELLQVSLNTEWLVLIAKYISELSSIYAHIDVLTDMSIKLDRYDELIAIYSHLDELLALGLAPYDSIPLMNQYVGNSGTLSLYARGDHIHPSDNSKVDITTFNNKVAELIILLDNKIIEINQKFTDVATHIASIEQTNISHSNSIRINNENISDLRSIILAIEGSKFYTTEFNEFFEIIPPEGWYERNGQEISEVNNPNIFARLFNYLNEPNNLWKWQTEERWNEISNVAGGIGGTPWFALITDTLNQRSIRLPDTRGDVVKCAGSNFVQVVGDWHGDAIRNITGTLYMAPQGGGGGGVFYSAGTQASSSFSGSANWGRNVSYMDASRTVPTAAENTPRVFAMMGCVYLGVE